MTKEQKLKCNIAAAELLGYDVVGYDVVGNYDESSYVLYHDEDATEEYAFCIFASTADCLDVVKKFGELYQVSFYFIRNKGWGAVDYYDSPMFDDIYSTLEEAVGAACLEIEVAGYGSSKAYKAAT